MAEQFADVVATIRADSTQLRSELAASEKVVAASSARMAASAGVMKQGFSLAERAVLQFGGSSAAAALSVGRLASEAVQVAGKVSIVGTALGAASAAAAAITGPMIAVGAAVVGVGVAFSGGIDWLARWIEGVDEAEKRTQRLTERLKEQQAAQRADSAKIRTAERGALIAGGSHKASDFLTGADREAALIGERAAAARARSARETAANRSLIAGIDAKRDATTEGYKADKRARIESGAAAELARIEGISADRKAGAMLEVSRLRSRLADLNNGTATGATFGISSHEFRGNAPVGALIGPQREQQKMVHSLAEIEKTNKKLLQVIQMNGLGGGVSID